MSSAISTTEFLPGGQRPKRVCPICSRCYVYFCVACHNNYKSEQENEKLSLEEVTQKSSYLCIAKEKFLKLFLALYSYVFDRIRLSKFIEGKKQIVLERIYFCPNMEEDSGVDSRQETLSTTSTISNESNRSAGEQPRSSASLHSRKSSNFFIQMLKSKRKRSMPVVNSKSPIPSRSNVKEKSDLDGNEDAKTHQTKGSKSKIPIPAQRSEKKEEAGIQTQSAKTSSLEESDEILTDSTQPQSEASISSKPKKGGSFLTKFMKKQSNRDYVSLPGGKLSTSAGTDDSDYECKEEAVEATSADEKWNDFNDEIEMESIAAVVPTTYLRSADPVLETTLAEALQQVLEIETKLKDDQNHVTQLIEKYIHDQGFKKELMDAVYQYSKLQLDTERRVQNLANEMWIQQAEISRNQENNLQESLNAIIKQNRQLQEEQEHLLRRNEKLSAKIASLTYLTPRTNLGENPVVESLTKNNEKLHKKLNAAVKEITTFEEELQKVQRQNQRLEVKLRHSNAQIQNYKAIVQRNKADFDLEIAALSQKLQTNLSTVKSVTDAGDILLEDLDALKRKLKASSCTLNWTKFKCHGNSMTDLIHMSRACINELSQEIVDLQVQIALKDKDSECSKEQIDKLQDEISYLREDLNNSKQKEALMKQYESEKQVYKEKNADLSKETNALQEEVKELSELLEKMKADSRASFDHIEHLKAELVRKDESSKDLQRVLEDVQAENRVLVLQTHNLNKLLQESGAGEMAKQISEFQERASYFEKLYYELVNEKKYLIEQADSNHLETERLIQQQQMHHEQIEAQRIQLDSLTNANNSLTEQLNEYKITITALQEERKRYLEEKNLLRTIYQRLKAEMARSEQLQGTVANMSKETNKLTVIAECNKLLGEKLKVEVKQREETITMLQNNIKALSNANLETTRDKIALCVELSEINSKKEHLNNVLSQQIEKNYSLDETKRTCESEAMFKVKALEEMQKAERLALKKLLEDYKKVVAQRDQLLLKQKEWTAKVASLQESCEMQNRNSTEIQNRCEEKEHSIRELEKRLQEKQHNVHKLQVEVDNYRHNSAKLTGRIEDLKLEKVKLEESIKYLQNTCQKLYNDFNASKASEMELKTSLQLKNEENAKLKSVVQELHVEVQKREHEKRGLIAEIENLSSTCNKLVNEYEKHLVEESDMESRSKAEIENLKTSLAENTMQIHTLQETLSEKASEICELKAVCKTLQKERAKKIVAEEELDIQGRILSETNSNHAKVVNELKELQEKYENTLSESLKFSEELNNAKNELEKVLIDKEKEYDTFTSQLEEIKEEFSEENDNLRESLEELTAKYEELKNSYQKNEMSSKHLSDSHKDLTLRLMKAVRLLIDEKIARKSERCRLDVVSNELIKLREEKESLMDKIGMLMTELNTLQTQCEILEESKAENESIKTSQETVQGETFKKLQRELAEAHDLIRRLKTEIEKLTKDITTTEFQKCELSLRVHELQGELSTEKGINSALRKSHQHFLDTIVHLREKGEISESILNSLTEKH